MIFDERKTWVFISMTSITCTMCVYIHQYYVVKGSKDIVV